MDNADARARLVDPSAGPMSAQVGELSCSELLTGEPLPLDPRLMESLPWKKVNNFIAAVGSERSLEGLAHAVLREIGTLVPCDYGVFGVADSRTLERPVLVIDFRTPPQLRREYFDHFVTVDPCLPLYPYTRRGIVSWWRHDGEFTRDFLRRYSCRHAMQVRDMEPQGGVGFNFAIQRTTRLGFAEREMAVFFLLRPHLHNLFSLIHAPLKARRATLVSAVSACNLTPREGQVVILLCERLSAAEIADRLKISRRTVEKHVEHVYLKLHVRNSRGLREQTILADALGNPLMHA